MIATLEHVKNALATIAGIASLKIGLEANLTASDYPMLRIVPMKATPGEIYGYRTIDLTIYLGLPMQPFDDSPDDEGRVRLEKLYAALFALEEQVIAQIESVGVRYRETILDEDRIEAYKLLAVRGVVEG